MAALLLRAQLVFEVNAGGAGANQAFGKFEDVERAAEAGLGVGDDRQVPVSSAAPFERLDLIEPRQRVVHPFHHRRHAVDRVEALIGIHLSRGLPSAATCQPLQ